MKAKFLLSLVASAGILFSVSSCDKNGDVVFDIPAQSTVIIVPVNNDTLNTVMLGTGELNYNLDSALAHNNASAVKIKSAKIKKIEMDQLADNTYWDPYESFSSKVSNKANTATYDLVSDNSIPTGKVTHIEPTGFYTGDLVSIVKDHPLTFSLSGKLRHAVKKQNEIRIKVYFTISAGL